MPLGGAVVAGAAGLGSAIIGGNAASDKLKAAQAAREAAVKQWLSIHVPDPAQQAIELQKYQVAGQLSPALETAFQQNQSELKNLSVDPTSRAAEVQALTQMQDVASHGGMDAGARLAETQAVNQANTNEQGQRGAIMQNYAARGVGGAGAELAAQLQASQGDANQAASTGMSSAASAEQRALQAMASSGNIASNLNSQDYGQAAKAAEAQDAINRFNTQNSQTVANSNVTNQNAAQAANLANAQSIANANVGVDNTQETHNKGLIQQQFDDQTKIASGVSNAESGVADQSNRQAASDSQMWGNIGNAVAQGATAIGQYANSTKKSDDQSEDDSSDESES